MQQLESSPDSPRILASLAASGHTQVWDLHHERQICSLATAATCMVITLLVCSPVADDSSLLWCSSCWLQL